MHRRCAIRIRIRCPEPFPFEVIDSIRLEKYPTRHAGEVKLGERLVSQRLLTSDSEGTIIRKQKQISQIEDQLGSALTT